MEPKTYTAEEYENARWLSLGIPIGIMTLVAIVGFLLKGWPIRVSPFHFMDAHLANFLFWVCITTGFGSLTLVATLRSYGLNQKFIVREENGFGYVHDGNPFKGKYGKI